jgi:hypothetical protein
VKLIRKKFKEGDKIVPLPEADFHYRLSSSILEVEHNLYADNIDCEDTYVHLWKTKDRHVLFGTKRKSFKVDSRYFRLMTGEDMAEFMLEDL